VGFGQEVPFLVLLGGTLGGGGEALRGLRGLWVLGEGAANRRGWWLC
jgi:hypothetical protein